LAGPYGVGLFEKFLYIFKVLVFSFICHNK